MTKLANFVIRHSSFVIHMKLALVHYTTSPVVGGVERIIEEHAQLLASHGHEITVQCHARDLGAQDVVLIHNVLTMPFDLPFTQALHHAIAAHPHVRFVAWTHDVAAANPDLAPVPDLIRRPPPNVEFIAISALRRRQLRDALGVENCTIIPNGIDPARILGLPSSIATLAENEHLLDGRLILLHPTRLLRRKNIEASIAITQALGEATLIITGAPDPHNPASREYAQTLRTLAGPETLFAADHFPVGDPELAALYHLADALIFPSRQEGFGLPLLEARLHRLPTIYSAIEPLTELAAPHALPISPDESPCEVAARIQSWLAQNEAHQDRKRALADYAWPTIYQRHIAPLLQKTSPTQNILNRTVPTALLRVEKL